MTTGADPALVIQRKLIFITGASRSGTTLLSFVLRNHPQVFGLKELQYFGQAWDPRTSQRSFSRSSAIEAVALVFARQERGILAGRIEPEDERAATAFIDGLGAAASDPAVVFAAAVHKLAAAGGKSIPCEQTPRNIFYAQALLDLYPAAHIVHIVRDPRAVMASQKMRWQLRQMAASGAAVSRYEAIRVWVNYHPYTITRLWSRATEAALALAAHPRMTVLRFEDLVQQPESTVRELCTRLDLPYDAKMLDVGQINSSHQSSVGGARRGLHATAIDKWRQVLSATEIATTERACGPLMRRFGYESTATEPVGLPAELFQRLTYIAHLGGVLAINPRRAYIQAKALWLARSRPSAPPTTGKPAPQGDPSQ